MPSLEFEITHSNERARCGNLTTPHGKIQTPVFMPVGTRGAVKTLTSEDLKVLGAEIILGNTYHLKLRPGDEMIESLGGLHKFINWDRPILTDSGGYQVLSLSPQIKEDGVVFKSIYDGSSFDLNPSLAVDIQARLGSDIQMVLDICPPLPESPEVIKKATEQTLRFAEQAREAFLSHPKTESLAQFGIIQGGLDVDLRIWSARRTTEMGFEGYALGGLSVGETAIERQDVLTASAQSLPLNSPRYLMGVGDPVSLIEGIAAGIDMFDCVLPTRLARHGTVLTNEGRLNLKAARFAKDESPIDAKLPKSPVGQYSRAYLRHLLMLGEPTAARILTLHNLAWIFDLMHQAREAIKKGNLLSLLKEVQEGHQQANL